MFDFQETMDEKIAKDALVATTDTFTETTKPIDTVNNRIYTSTSTSITLTTTSSDGCSNSSSNSTSNMERRKDYKRVQLSSQKKRREEMLARQRQARRDLTSHVRSLTMAGNFASSDVELADSAAFTSSVSSSFSTTTTDTSISLNATDTPTATTMETEVEQAFSQSPILVKEDSKKPITSTRRASREDRVAQRRAYYSEQLMTSEWMLEVPEKLNGKNSLIGEGWYVVPRPEGKRCLVIASNGQTVARVASGSILKSFPSALPNGSRKTTRTSEEFCVLDCIFQETNQTFYVLDVMCWKGYLLYNCTTEFRFFWARTKLDETSVDTVTSSNPFPFRSLPYYECDASGVDEAYSNIYPYIKDGLLFFMKASEYCLGLSPLVLTWKDPHCSRYFAFSEVQTIVLHIDAEGHLRTMDDIVLSSLTNEFMVEHEIHERDLLRFSISGAHVDLDGIPHVNGLTYVKRCSPQRGLADSWSKILFQSQASSDSLSIQTILDATGDAVQDIDMDKQ